MASRFADRPLWLCVCGHSHSAHKPTEPSACSFCGCLKFIPDDIDDEFFASEEDPFESQPSPIPPFRRLDQGPQHHRGN